MKLIRLEHSSDNESLVLDLLEKAPAYCLNVSGEIAGLNDGKEVFEALPPSFPREDKHVIGIFTENIIIGMVDCLIGFPTKDKAHIGLLLLSENYQSQGLGKLAYINIESYLRKFPSISKMRLAVVKTNNKVNKLINSDALIMEKELV